MPDILIYTKDYCPYCQDAKALLKQKGVNFTEIDILKHPEKRAEMLSKANGRSSVPQIFIDSAHIGGCDDIYALEAKGGLDPLLQRLP